MTPLENIVIRCFVVVFALTALSCAEGTTVGANRLLVSTDLTGDWEILDVNLDSSIAIPITKNTGGNNKDPSWSPNGGQVATSSNRLEDYELFILDLDGSVVRQLTDNHVSDEQPAWSPDGGFIAFKSDRTGDVELFVMLPDGTEIRQLTNSPGEDWHPAWSPDGRSLAFASNRNGNWDIFVMLPDGTEIRQLTDSPDTDLEPVWSPDGKQLAFTSNRDGRLEVFLLEVSSQNISKTGITGIPADWRYSEGSEE